MFIIDFIYLLTPLLMFLFKSAKKLSHRQTASIGFVLGVMSLVLTALVVYGYPMLDQWLYEHGVFTVQTFLIGLVVTVFLAGQGLLLFGFPLYYVQDKKSHLAGLQVLVYALLSMLLLGAILAGLMVAMSSSEAPYALDAFGPAPVEEGTAGELVPTEEAPTAQ